MIPIPYFRIAAAVVVAVLLAGTHWKAYHAGGVSARAELAAYKQTVAENTRKAELAARVKEQAKQTEVERVQDEAAKKQTVLAARAVAAERTAVSLRNEVARLNARPAPQNPEAAAFAREASTARELLGACAAEYRSVAEVADGLRDQVIGLQDYVHSVALAK